MGKRLMETAKQIKKVNPPTEGFTSWLNRCWLSTAGCLAYAKPPAESSEKAMTGISKRKTTINKINQKINPPTI